MGIKNFSNLINNNKKLGEIRKLRGKGVIIDALWTIYHFSKNLMVKKNGEDSELYHIKVLVNLSNYFLKYGITPIFVFEGKAPRIKKQTIEKRKIKKEESKNELLELNNNGNEKIYNRLLKDSFRLIPNSINECKNLLTMMGIPWVQALGEADPTCAMLNYYFYPKIDFILSGDSDIIFYGGIKMVSWIDFQNGNYEYVLYTDLLNDLSHKINYNLKHFNLIDIAILLGTDYSNGISTLLSQKFDINQLLILYEENNFSLCNILNNINQYNDENYRSWLLVKALYKDCLVVHPEKLNLRYSDTNLQNLRNYLFEKKFVEGYIELFLQNIEKGRKLFFLNFY
jgi:flap endonuclease-1